jgi:lysophospholipase L1-like esterase
MAFALLLSTAGRAAADAAPSLQAGDFVAVCGDSITEQKLYSMFIEDYLLMCRPAPKLRTLQAGWGGEVAEGFFNRVNQDVLTLHPTVATTSYGMNDGGYGTLDQWRANWYRSNYTNAVRELRKGGVRLVVVGSPGGVDSDTFQGDPKKAEVYNQTLSQLRDIAREVAQSEKAVFANVFDPMMDVMDKAKAKYGHGYHVAGNDGVHPWNNGHLVMAYAFLKALGCDGNIGTITLNLATNTAEATEGHKVLSCANGTLEVESTRYPFCFYGDPVLPGSTTGIIDFFPFNQDLNRLLLVVKGCPPDSRYKVMWGGGVGKVFKASDLAKGVNLAGEFLANPFVEPFRKVEQAVRAQQDFETLLTKVLLHNLLPYKQAVPEEAAALDRIQANVIARDNSFATASSDAILPVKHTIQVQLVP